MVRRIFAVAFFLVLIIPDMLGWEVSFGPGLSIKNAFLYLLFVGLGLQMAIEGRLQEIELPTVHLFFLLLIFDALFMWVFASTVANYRAYNMLDGLMALKSLLIDHYLVFLVYFYLLRTGDDAIWAMKRILGITAIVNGLIVIDSYDIVDLGMVGQDETGRVQGALNDSRSGANEYARFVILFLPAFIFGMTTAVGLKRAAYIVAVFVAATAVLLTTSRGALLGLFAGLFLGWFYIRELVPLKTIAKPAAALVVGLIVIGVFSSPEFSELFYERFMGKTNVSDMETASSGRTHIWGTALAEQAKAPHTFVIGHGWRVYNSMDFRYATHNHYLSYLFNLGVIGLGLFLALSMQVLRVAKQGAEFSSGLVRWQLLGFILGFVSLLIALFFSEIFKVWLFVWAYAGIAMRMSLSAITAATPMAIHHRSQKLELETSPGSSRGGLLR